MNQSDDIELQIDKLLVILADQRLDDLSKKNSLKKFLSDNYITIEQHRIICSREFRRGRNNGMCTG